MVSVIMPAYNAEGTIIESISSVIDQTYNNWELLVINDGSKDNSADIVRTFQKQDGRIKLIDLKRNMGLPNARNEGCKLAKGKFIAFLDSDDLWEKEKLATQIAFHQKYPEVEISHTDFQAFNKNGIVKRPWKKVMERKRDKQGFIYPNICYRNLIGILTVMVKTDTLRQVGFFDTTLWTLEDQDLWVRIASQKNIFGFIDKHLALYRISESGISKKTGKYKKAYKHYLQKIISTNDINSRLLWRTYYRNFGTVYLRKSEFKLSRLYFCKSLILVPFDFITMTTCVYMIYGIAKSYFGMINKNGNGIK